MRRALLVLCCSLPALVLAQPAESGPGARAPGTKPPLSRTDRRRHDMGEVRQPEPKRPDGLAELTPTEAESLLREILAANPDRTVEELLPGLERYRALRERLSRLAKQSGGRLRLSALGQAGGLGVDRIDIAGEPTRSNAPKKRVLVVGGVHAGTEVAGVEAAARFVESAAAHGLKGVDVTIIPLLNPSSLVLGSRRNLHDVDVNRSFQDGEWTEESRLIRQLLKTQRYEASLDLHGAGMKGRDGFFLIRYAEDGGLGERVMRSMKTADLLDVPGAGGKPSKVGPYLVHSLGVATSGNAGTLKAYLAENGARYSYTMEAPTRFDPRLQVRGLLRMVRAGVSQVSKLKPSAPTRAPKPAAEADPYRAARRVDGTIDWGRVKKAAASEAAGLGKFGLALFLKELAVVARTGDRARIEEFFDGLLTTDFYREYGLFVVGARAGEVAYARYLDRFVRPRFVSSVLKTNLVLAAGLALPRIVAGDFSGKAFVVSLTSLGLSSTAVRAGIAGVKGAAALTPRTAGALRKLVPATRLTGWVYAAVELAVVLYAADEIESAIEAHLDRRDAVNALTRAQERTFAVLRRPDASAEQIRAALARSHRAWNDYRATLAAPLHRAEALLGPRLARVARKAKLAADSSKAAVDRLAKHPALRADLERRYGSLEAYARNLSAKRELAVRGEVDEVLTAYAAERTTLMRDLYHGGRRQRPLLGELADETWRASPRPDPWGERSDVLAKFARRLARGRLRSSLRSLTKNRLQSYADELELLDLAISGARDPARLGLLRTARARITETLALERRLAGGAVGALKRD